MKFSKRFLRAFQLILPLLVLGLLEAAPASIVVSADLHQARIAAENGQYQAAADALRRAVEREPWRSELWEWIGQNEAAAGRPAEAANALQAGLELGRLSPDGRFLLGECWQKLDRLDDAEAVWIALVRDTGPSVRVYERLAGLYQESGNIDAAVQTLRAWHAFDPQNGRAAFLLGLHLSVVQPEQAEAVLIQASQADQAYTSAVQVVRRGLAQAAISDQPAYGWLVIGRALGSIGYWDLAARAFEQATGLAPQYGEAWAFLGEARSQAGGSGKTELDKALQLAPESALVHVLAAISLRRQGQYPQALAALEQAVQLEPQEPAWRLEMGYTLAANGDLAQAQAAFEKAIDLNPKDSAAWQALANFSTQYSVDIRGLGLPAARQAVLLAPDEASALDTMGWLLLNLGDAVSAERFLQRALASDATYDLANLHLGQLYLQKNSRQAYEYLQRAASGAGDNSVGTTARRLLERYFGGGG